MTDRRISPNAGWAERRQLPKGPGGRNLCRWCSQEVGKGRRTFCSDACVHEHKIRSNPGYVRAQVLKRDHGVCGRCGVDTEALQERLRLAWRHLPSYFRGVDWQKLREEAFAKAEIPEKFRGLETTRSWWEADHIVPVVEGGGECGLEGYRTLCVPCHREETRELRQRLAQTRRKRQDGPGATQTTDPTQDPKEASKATAALSPAPARGRIERTPVHRLGAQGSGELAGVPGMRREAGGPAGPATLPAVRKGDGG